jgi:hypothetical protein
VGELLLRLLLSLLVLLTVADDPYCPGSSFTKRPRPERHRLPRTHLPYCPGNSFTTSLKITMPKNSTRQTNAAW